MTTEPSAPEPPTTFHDLSRYLPIPPVSGLPLSPDGTRLLTTVATPDPQSRD